MSPRSMPVDITTMQNRAVALTDDTVKALPSAPGIYASWIITRTGLREAGITGPPPVLTYIGRGQDLSARLGHRLTETHILLNELLATRGTVLFAFGARLPRLKSQPSRWRPSPLAQLAYDQTTDWQQRHTVWAWQECRTREEAVRAEERLIASSGPLLNRVGGGTVIPQLRRGRGYERARARWLWHMSWASALFTTRAGYVTDPEGYPAWERDAQRPAAPRDLQQMMTQAGRDAAPDVRDAIAQGVPAREARLWWAAHAADTTHLSATLCCVSEKELDVAPRLPKDREDVDELVRLTKALKAIRY
jgi:hypothetical protein